MRRITETAAFVTLLAIWGLTPLLILLLLVFHPEAVLATRFMSLSTILWSFASVFLFGFLLHHRDYFDESGVDSLMGLTCTLVIGIPAMAFSSLPMFGSPVDFLQALNPKGNTVSLADLKPSDARTLYIVGIDISKSFVKDPNDPRLGMVMDAFDSLFLPVPNNAFAHSFGPKDALHAYVFAGKHKRILDVQGILGGREQIPDFHNKVVAAFSEPLDYNSTDLLRFLNVAICGEIGDYDKDQEKGFTHIKVIIFSDWIQSSPDRNGSSHLQDQRIHIKEFRDFVKDHGNVSFLEFRSSPQGNGELMPESVESDIGRQLRYSFSEERWQHLDLKDYNEARPEEKPTMPALVYSNDKPSDSIYLKYLPDPGWSARPSWIKLPKTERSEDLFIAFRPLTSDASPVRVEMTPGNGEEVVIDMNERESAARINTESSLLQLKLTQRSLSSRDARIEMLVVAPRSSTVYRIPVVVLPVLREDAITVLRLIVLAMHLLPLVLAAKIYRSRKKRLLDKTAAVPASS